MITSTAVYVYAICYMCVCVCVCIRAIRTTPLGLLRCDGRTRHHLVKREEGTDTFQISILIGLKGIYFSFENYFMKLVLWLLTRFACFGSKSKLIIIYDIQTEYNLNCMLFIKFNG